MLRGVPDDQGGVESRHPHSLSGGDRRPALLVAKVRRHEEEKVLSDATYHGQALSQPGESLQIKVFFFFFFSKNVYVKFSRSNGPV